MTIFSLLCALAVAIGLIWLSLEEKSVESLNVNDPAGRVDQAVMVFILSIVGSRLGYVAVHVAYFMAYPLEGLQFWLGGLSGSGALLGGLVGVVITGFIYRNSPLQLAERMVRLGALLAAAVWLGSWLMGSAYGLISEGWWALPSVDEWGHVDKRLPVQLAGAIFALGWMAFLDWRTQFRPSAAGVRSGAWLWGMGVVMTGLSLLRGDPALMWNSLRVDTWGGIGVALAGMVCFAIGIVAGREPNDKIDS